MLRLKSTAQRIRLTAIIGLVLLLGATLGWPLYKLIVLSIENWNVPVFKRDDDLQIKTSLLFFTRFIYVWFFSFGACVGSFLNVVIWRMPRGETVVTRPSRCPFCCNKLKSHDNIPVFGWLFLGGRCRNCLLPISIRYPLVEAVMGGIFVCLLHVEIFIDAEVGSGRYGHIPMFEILYDHSSIVVFHCTLASLLICWALIAWDRSRTPLKLSVFAVAIGFVCPIIWPHLRLTNFEWIPTLNVADPTRLTELFKGIGGLIVGLGFGWLLLWASNQDSEATEERRWGSVIGMGTVGLFLGIQPLLIVLPACLAVALVLSPVWKRIERSDFAGLAEMSLLITAVAAIVTQNAWLPWLVVQTGSQIPPIYWLAPPITGFLGYSLYRITFQQKRDLTRFSTQKPELPTCPAD